MEPPPTHTVTTSAFHVEVSLAYIKTVPGALKIIEMVLSIIAFGCAVGSSYSNLGWVNFVAITGFMHAIFYLVIHLTIVLHHKYNIVIELVLYAIWTLLFFIAGIVAASFDRPGSSAGAASAFSFFSMAAWAVDTALQARHVKITWTDSSSTTTATNPNTFNNTDMNQPPPPKYEEAVQY